MKQGGTVAYLGRFQPFHKGHLKVVQNLLARHDRVYLIIGSADKSYRKNNPFTAAERYEMIRYALLEEGITGVEVFMVDDYEDDFVWVKQVQKRVPPFQFIVANNPYVWTLFKNDQRGYSPVYTVPVDRDVFTASNVRRLMVNGEDFKAENPLLIKWRNLVPEVVAAYIIANSLDERVRDLHREE